MRRRRAWLLTLGPIGSAALVYVVVVRGFLAPGETAGAGLGWALLGVLPSFVFGLWLLAVTTSRVAFYVALGGMGSAVGVAYETLVQVQPSVILSDGFPLLNGVGLTGDALAVIGGVLTIATFPDGTVERRWQRVALRLSWAPALVAPLSLLTIPHLVTPKYAGIGNALPNPHAVPSLAWAAPVVELLVYEYWVALAVAVAVFYVRALFGSPATRLRLRVLAIVTTASVAAYFLWSSSAALGVTGTPVGFAIQAAVFVTSIALPVALIHGILRHGALDVAPDDRGPVVVRSSALLITMIYGIAVATPMVLLSDRLETAGAVLLTTFVAVALLPVRAWLQQWIRRAVVGDRDRQLEMLGELGARLEQAVEPGDLLGRLAQALRDGLDASWVRISLTGFDAEAVRSEGAGDASGPAVAVHDLVEGETLLGRIEVGPRRLGAYSLTEQRLLATVAAQATTALANVRLTAQLAEQLSELSASRVRLVAAQDDERRRIERDLHDGIQQNVVALIASLRLARNRLERGELRPEDLTELQDQARETLADLRELAQGIHPQVLTDNGLVAAIESRTARFPIPLTVSADDRVRAERLSPDLETTAYYVVHESLANVAKHADAKAARVRLSRRDGHLLVEVEDDGHGFDLASTNGHGGLANIRDRVAAVRGRVHVASHSGSGTTITAELPLP